LTCDTINELIDSGIDRINISIYGLSESQYEEVSGVKIDFEKFLENISYLNENKRNCMVTIKICDISLKTPEDKNIFFDTFSGICNTISIEHIVPIWYEMEYNNRIVGQENDIYGKKKIPKKICPVPFFSLAVHPNGDVSPCCQDWQHKLVLGNINNETLYQIWNGKIYYDFCFKQLEKGRKAILTCANCEYPEVVAMDNIDIYSTNVLEHYKRRAVK
jgi:radical SAM protein with 4Fe4S-binding SPASM domain